MSYQLPALPYPYNGLEPHFDAQTMEIHHTKHHAAYVANLNKALESAGVEAPECVYGLLKNLNDLPEAIRTAVRNNGGGHANHSFFWPLLSPTGNGKPVGALAEAINNTFGSLGALKEKFGAAALTRFGSGWAWLGVLPGGELSIGSTPNQDHPCMPNVDYKGWPVLGLDVWEHAYYLKYQNRRADYITAFWNVLNWEQAEAYYQAGLAYFAGLHGCKDGSCK